MPHSVEKSSATFVYLVGYIADTFLEILHCLDIIRDICMTPYVRLADQKKLDQLGSNLKLIKFDTYTRLLLVYLY